VDDRRVPTRAHSPNSASAGGSVTATVRIARADSTLRVRKVARSAKAAVGRRRRNGRLGRRSNRSSRVRKESGPDGVASGVAAGVPKPVERRASARRPAA